MDDNLKPFLEELAEALDIEDQELEVTTKLEDLDWDSLAVISSIALIDEYFNRKISANEISQCSTIGDLLNIGK